MSPRAFIRLISLLIAITVVFASIYVTIEFVIKG
jgi:hypothetical protein